MTLVDLYVGRFQIFHNGHLDAINQINNKEVMMGIGSSQEKGITLKNPFSYKQREDMLKILGFDNFLPIPDFNSKNLWADYIRNQLPNLGYIFSENPLVLEPFKDNSKKLERKHNISSTSIKNKIVYNEDWRSDVPKIIHEYICDNSLDKHIKKLAFKEERRPLLAVDGIVEYRNGIVLIERKFEPYGFALPGGFVNYGETLEDAIKREIEEELNLVFNIKGFLGNYSKVDRDPRGQVISCVYFGNGEGTIKAKDDAKDYIIVPINKLYEKELVFDHKTIIQDYLQKIK